MAEETWKTDEHAANPAGTIYKQVAPAGVAAELNADATAAPETVTALSRWLTETLAADPSSRERVAGLSGLSLSELTSLLDGHPLFRLDTDHIQRIATALVEAQIIPHTDAVWNAIGSDSNNSEYLVPPTQVLQAMSDN